MQPSNNPSMLGAEEIENQSVIVELRNQKLFKEMKEKKKKEE
jgi:hypothetical protein